MIRNRTRVLLERFKGREDLGKIGVYNAFFRSLGFEEKDVFECLEEIELEYEIPPGVLRPEDSMSKLNERVGANNPIEWFWWLGGNEFSGDGLIEELNIRLIKHGTWSDWKEIDTVGDLIAAWCGRGPKSAELTVIEP